MTTKRIPAGLAACAILLASACGGDDGGGGEERARTIAEPSSTAAPQQPEGDGDKTLSEAELSAALLTVADLPTGYKAVPPTEDDDSETTGGDEECSAKFEQLSGAEGTRAASAEAAFEGGFGTILEESLESYEDEDQLEQRFDDVVSVLSQCPTFSSTEDGQTTDFTLAGLSFPKLGDDTVALAVTGKTPDFEITLNIATVRLGRNVMSVSQGGLTADAAVLEQVARSGLDKLAAATG